MTAAQVAGTRSPRSPRPRRGSHRLLWLPLLVFAAVASMAFIYVVYVLWPRWPGPPVGADAPALPITIAGVTFNVPPAAIRVPVQRRPGAQERLDLAFLWPSLEPPDVNAKPQPASAAAAAPPQIVGRVFMTISAAANTLAPLERMASIYPRYAVAEAVPGPDGLAVLAFREGTPYQGEDLDLRRCRAGVSGALQPRRRGSHPRHMPVRATDRNRRCGGALPARLARGLAHGRRHHRSPGRAPASRARMMRGAERRPARYPFSRPGSSRSSARIGSSK